MVNFIKVQRRLTRLDKIEKDNGGYHIKIMRKFALFDPKYEKVYLNGLEIKEYEGLKEEKRKQEERQEAIIEAKKEGRYTKVEQIIKNGNKTGIYAYEYYDKEGNVI